ncbi:hypothetical protein PsorP6_012834 [Peronosclerospora sorghi]|uniref:Uncharacterized protein n=1 Tax=Peronosclerospora sorghi TaxID=230839 RepID=A0ACC0WHP1_9STRA|nr:hypothetical protein PsorP6_012834 [Peronosclerospora sorghi]
MIRSQEAANKIKNRVHQEIANLGVKVVDEIYDEDYAIADSTKSQSELSGEPSKKKRRTDDVVTQLS